MPFAQLKDARIHYQLAGPQNAPVLVLSNSLGTDLSMWNPQITEFTKRLRVLRYDTRGHGQSSVTPGPYSIEQLARDVIALLDALHLDRVHFCGLSMGGMIGMWLGTSAPERLHKLVLCDTAAKIGTPETWNLRIETVRKHGMASVASSIIERWFTPSFRAAAPATVAATQRMLENASPEGYVACCAAVRDMDHREKLSAIHALTLVIAGAHDPATPPADSHFLAGRIPGARYVELDAAHLSNMEDPDRFNAGVAAFLNAEEVLS